jgi:uncharacterized protein (TIGR02246 family)
MPVRTPARLALLTMVLLLTACTPTTTTSNPSPQTDAAVRRAVEEANREIVRASRHHDAAAIAARFAPDAVLLMDGVQPIYGRQAIADMYAGFLQGNHVEDSSITTLELTVLGDYAIEMGTNSVTMRPRGQNRAMVRPGKYLVVWKRQPDGTWLIWRDAPTLNVQG